eukprot:6418833-Alexandrium_andersonii.AAC.1
MVRVSLSELVLEPGPVSVPSLCLSCLNQCRSAFAFWVASAHRLRLSVCASVGEQMHTWRRRKRRSGQADAD